MSDGLLDDSGLFDIDDAAQTTDPRQVVDEERNRKQSIPERNAALGDWAARLGDGGDVKDRAENPRDECHLCTAAGRNVCKQCERKTCSSHFWVMFGLCRTCAREDQVNAWHKDSEPDESNWLAG